MCSQSNNTCQNVQTGSHETSTKWNNNYGTNWPPQTVWICLNAELKNKIISWPAAWSGQARNQPSADGGVVFLKLWTPSRPLLSPLPFPPFPSLLHSLPSLPFSPLSLPSFPSPPFPPPPSGGPNPLTAARKSGGALKLPHRVRAEPGRRAVSGAFWAKKSDSGYSNLKFFCLKHVANS